MRSIQNRFRQFIVIGTDKQMKINEIIRVALTRPDLIDERHGTAKSQLADWINGTARPNLSKMMG